MKIDVTPFDAYDTIYLGVSGGLDSSVLLHFFAAQPHLKSKLTVLHVHHGLSPHADQWALHCQTAAAQYQLPCHIKHVTLVNKNIEAQARTLRYQWFESFMSSTSCLILAHHQDDQTETFLLQLLRGAGITGLRGMVARRPFKEGVIFRPFLDLPRIALEQYARSHQLSYVEDESNANPIYARNFLRNSIIPLLKQRWPGLTSCFTRAFKQCQEADDLLYDLALMDLPDLNQTCIDIATLQYLPKPRILNGLKYWLQANQIKVPSTAILEQILQQTVYGRPDTQTLIQWSSIQIRKHQGQLYLHLVETEKKWLLAHHTTVNDQTLPAITGLRIPEHAVLRWGFRQGGETLRFRGQTKQLKKLFQEWKVPFWQRAQIPLLFINEELALVGDLAIADHYNKLSKSCKTLSSEGQVDPVPQ